MPHRSIMAAHGRVALVLTLFTAGCVSRAPFIQTQTAPEGTGHIQQVTDKMPWQEDFLVSSIPPEEEVRARINEAKESLRGLEYEAADRHLRLAIESLRRVESAESSHSAIEAFYDEIATMYGRQMPVDYFDRIPDEISAQVFRDLLFRYGDSLQVSAQDSIALTKLLSQSNTTYDFPMVWNDRVFRALVFLSRGRKGPVGRWLLRSTAYLPFIQKLFSDSGLPVDLSYLPLIESGFSTIAYSHAHASGMWQFIPATGVLYGLRRSFWVDERRDPVKSTIAAIRYLKRLYAEFGDWHIALASYNTGEGNMRRAIARAGINDYWQLKLHRETMSYIPQFIASLIVAKNRAVFGFPLDTLPVFDPDTVHVSDCIDMAAIAKAVGVEYDTLKLMNPHILHWCTPPDVERVTLFLPKGTREQFEQFLSDLPQQKITRWYRYRLRRGENLATLSRHFGVSADALRSANRLRSNRLPAGTQLMVPFAVRTNQDSLPDQAENIAVPSTTAMPDRSTVSQGRPIRYRVKSGDTVYGLAKLFNVAEQDILDWNSMSSARQLKAGAIITLYPAGTPNEGQHHPEPTALGTNNPGTYEVKQGDNLTAIARKTGVSVDNILKWNRRQSSDPIFPGDVLLLAPPATEQSSPPLNAEPSLPPPASPTSADTVLYKIAPGDNIGALARLFGVEISTLLSLNGLTAHSVLKPGEILRIPAERNRNDHPQTHDDRSSTIFYRVQTGDSLWRVAQLFNVSVEQLYRSNGLSKDSVLMPGDTLKIRRSERL